MNLDFTTNISKEEALEWLRSNGADMESLDAGEYDKVLEKFSHIVISHKHKDLWDYYINCYKKAVRIIKDNDNVKVINIDGVGSVKISMTYIDRIGYIDFNSPDIYMNIKTKDLWFFKGVARMNRSNSRKYYVMENCSDIVLFSKDELENKFLHIGHKLYDGRDEYELDY